VILDVKFEADKFSELQAGLARSRILEAAYNHLREAADEEAWTLKFELSFQPIDFEQAVQRGRR